MIRDSCKPQRPCCRRGRSLYRERSADGKPTVSFAVLMLGRPGRKKKTEGLQYRKALFRTSCLKKAVIRVSCFVTRENLKSSG